MSVRFRAISAVLALAAVGACTAAQAPDGSAQTAGQAAEQAATGSAAAGVAAADAQTLKIVDAAKTFIASLSEPQKKAAMFAFNDAGQRQRWSNFPQGIFERKGVKWGDLDTAQRTALANLLGAVLSPEGVRMMREQMDADDVLKANPGAGGGPPPGRGSPPAGGPPGGGRGPGGGGGPGGGLLFGSELYFVSFLGEPSATAPWMFQFGGHHLGVNATIAGANVTISPSLTGGQPVKYDKDGKAIYIVEKEVKQAAAMLAGLTAEQRKKAVISTKRIDLVLGPQHDGQTLQPEGLPGSEMTGPQKAQFLALIEARLGILNADDFAATMADVRKNIGQTYFAWYGPERDAGSAYFRATGPTLVLEFSPQDLGGDASNHLHNMYRNPVNDYGAAWASLK